MTTSTIRIREFTLDDYEAARRLWDVAEGLGPVPRYEVELKLRRDPELFLVAEEAGDLVGVVMGSFDGRRAWIFRLAVDPGRRREGIGRGLVAELEHRFVALGAPKVNLLVFTGNPGGRRFWEALGYPGYDDVVLHTKDLGASGGAAGDDPAAVRGAGC